MRTEIEGDQLVTYTADGTFFSSQPAETQTSPNSPETPSVLTLADVAAALRDPLANLTDSSASTTVRTAILNQRAALDALLTDINESVDMTTGVRTVVVDNGDGTGTRTTYDEHGNVTSVEHLTDLPIPDLPADPDLIPPDPTQLRSPR